MSDAAAPVPLPLAPLAGHEGLYVLTLEPNQGPMVVLDHALIRRLDATLDRLAELAPAPRGLILSSGSSRVFIAGADLKQIEAFDVPQLDAYLKFGQEVFGRLCTLSCPTVAALNGAALGGGLELAMHCDGLVAAPPPPRDGQPGRPYAVGLPEAGLSICPGWGGTNLLPARMDPALAITRTCAGVPLTLDEAVASGLVEALAPAPEALLETAAGWLEAHALAPGRRRDGEPSRWIGRDGVRNRASLALEQVRDQLPRTQASRACVQAIEAGLNEGWSGALRVERTELNRLRHTPEGQGAIRAFFDRSGPKKG